MLKKHFATLFALALALLAGPAMAEISVTPVTAAITEASTAIAVVGAAILVMIVGMKVWKWIARAL